MDDNKSTMYTFACMPTRDQHSVFDLCMRQTNIPWKTLLAKLFPEFQSKEFLIFMIKNYKESLDNQSPLQTPQRNPRYPLSLLATTTGSARSRGNTHPLVDVIPDTRNRQSKIKKSYCAP